ncbi:hypothetical protein [Mycobacterium sherrisii]|uniref:hypothetical protein n=1 Tax=Mycobacterium sherrisii TaxID=243061 RepID=UPI003FD8BFEA
MFALAGDWNSAVKQLSDAALQQAQSQVSSSLTGQTADAAAGVFAVACQGDGTTVLPWAWDRLFPVAGRWGGGD